MPDALMFTVPREHAGARVNRVVTQLLAEAGRKVTRSEVQRWIALGGVLANGRVVQKKDTLAEGTIVTVHPAEPLETDATPDPSVRFEVVHEDDALIVVDKPAGLVVHPARGHRTGTLVHGLLARGGFRADNADPRDREGHLRPGIVHRLDKDTSGLLVVAKTPECREGLKALFARHDIERSYLAIAEGPVSAASFDTTHGRHPTRRLCFTSRLPPDRPGVRRARTDVEPLEKLAGCTYVRCRLHTGRTHQIRVHLAEQAGAPVLGDPLYGPAPRRDARVAAVAAQLGRQALHAAVLGFVHPATGAAVRWESALPSDIAAALQALR